MSKGELSVIDFGLQHVGGDFEAHGFSCMGISWSIKVIDDNRLSVLNESRIVLGHFSGLNQVMVQRNVDLFARGQVIVRGCVRLI